MMLLSSVLMLMWCVVFLVLCSVCVYVMFFFIRCFIFSRFWCSFVFCVLLFIMLMCSCICVIGVCRLCEIDVRICMCLVMYCVMWFCIVLKVCVVCVIFDGLFLFSCLFFRLGLSVLVVCVSCLSGCVVSCIVS